MRTFVGRGAGVHFLDDLFMSEKYVYVVSRWISPVYAKRLIRMAREGVEVKVITSNDKLNKDALKILLKAIKPPKLLVFMSGEWQPPNMELGVIKEQYLHVKMYLFDDKLAVVGSANFTEAGMYQNIEHIVIFDKPEEIEKIKYDFKKLWKLYTEDVEVSEEILTLEDIARKIGKTVKELISIFKKKARNLEI